jgi:sulfatase maturation enzyme AslB (radical SAM superfamily)
MGVLASFVHATKRDVLISWLGGEPFLWPELQSLTVEARSFNLHVSTTTNGTMLGSKSLRSHILENYAELTVSIDGIGDTHNELREWKGGFDKLRTNITKLHEEKIEINSSTILRSNIVLMRDNIDQFIPLCHEIADWGISVITFNQLGGRDRPEFYPAHRLTASNVAFLEDILPDLKANLLKRGVTLLGSKAYMARFVSSAMGKKMPIVNCSVQFYRWDIRHQRRFLANV